MVHHIGVSIRAWRKFRNISQSDLAIAADMTSTAISRIEREGTRRSSSIRRIAKAMNITVVELELGPGVSDGTPVLPKSVVPLDQAEALFSDHATFNGQIMPESVRLQVYEFARSLMQSRDRATSLPVMIPRAPAPASSPVIAP